MSPSVVSDSDEFKTPPPPLSPLSADHNVSSRTKKLDDARIGRSKIAFQAPSRRQRQHSVPRSISWKNPDANPITDDELPPPKRTVKRHEPLSTPQIVPTPEPAPLSHSIVIGIGDGDRRILSNTPVATDTVIQVLRDALRRLESQSASMGESPMESQVADMNSAVEIVQSEEVDAKEVESNERRNEISIQPKLPGEEVAST